MGPGRRGGEPSLRGRTSSRAPGSSRSRQRHPAAARRRRPPRAAARPPRRAASRPGAAARACSPPSWGGARSAGRRVEQQLTGCTYIDKSNLTIHFYRLTGSCRRCVGSAQLHISIAASLLSTLDMSLLSLNDQPLCPRPDIVTKICRETLWPGDTERIERGYSVFFFAYGVWTAQTRSRLLVLQQLLVVNSNY